MVAPVGFGRSVPLMAPAGSSATGTSSGTNPAAGGAPVAAKKAPAKKGGAKKSKPKSGPKLVAPKDPKYVSIKAEGNVTSGPKDEFFFGKAVLNLDFTKIFSLGDNVYIGPEVEFTYSKGVEGEIYGQSADMAYFVGGLRTLKKAKELNGSVTLNFNYDSASEKGPKGKANELHEHHVAFKGGIIEGSFGFELEYTTPSLTPAKKDKDGLRLHLNGALTTDSFSVPVWSQSAKAYLTYKQPSAEVGLDHAKLQVELLNSPDSFSSKFEAGLGVYLGDDRKVSAKYQHVVLGDTYRNFVLAYDTSLFGLGFTIDGSYTKKEKVKTYGKDSPGISFDGTEIASPSVADGSDVWRSTAMFAFKLDQAKLSIGAGVARVNQYVDEKENSDNRYLGLLKFEY